MTDSRDEQKNAATEMLDRVAAKLSQAEQQRMALIMVAGSRYGDEGMDLAYEMIPHLPADFDREQVLKQIEQQLNQPPTPVDGVM